MRSKTIMLFWAVVAAGAQTDTAHAQKENLPKVNAVSYKQLSELVVKNRGKVVVVDFWATFCPPCIQALPHVAKMHDRLARYGVETITVSLDQIKENPAVMEQIKKHLKKANVNATNVVLDEDFDLIQKKLRFEGPPCAFVFDRTGQWREFKESQFQHELIEKTVVEFLQAK